MSLNVSWSNMNLYFGSISILISVSLCWILLSDHYIKEIILKLWKFIYKPELILLQVTENSNSD